MNDSEILNAFHLMWDVFPEPVMVIKKSHEIVAVNKKAEEIGVKVGIKCSLIGKPENHRGCLCDKAADSGEPVYGCYETAFGKSFGYWLPIPERKEWIIHFGVGGTFEYTPFKK